jgi:hypothetical protein
MQAHCSSIVMLHLLMCVAAAAFDAPCRALCPLCRPPWHRRHPGAVSRGHAVQAHHERSLGQARRGAGSLPPQEWPLQRARGACCGGRRWRGTHRLLVSCVCVWSGEASLWQQAVGCGCPEFATEARSVVCCDQELSRLPLLADWWRFLMPANNGCPALNHSGLGREPRAGAVGEAAAHSARSGPAQVGARYPECSGGSRGQKGCFPDASLQAPSPRLGLSAWASTGSGHSSELLQAAVHPLRLPALCSCAARSAQTSSSPWASCLARWRS